HRVDLRVSADPARPVRGGERRGKCAAIATPAGHADRLVAGARCGDRVAAEVERPREPAEQARPELRVLVTHGPGRLLEELHGARVVDAGAPARLLEPDRRASEELRVA